MADTRKERGRERGAGERERERDSLDAVSDALHVLVRGQVPRGNDRLVLIVRGLEADVSLAPWANANVLKSVPGGPAQPLLGILTVVANAHGGGREAPDEPDLKIRVLLRLGGLEEATIVAPNACHDTSTGKKVLENGKGAGQSQAEKLELVRHAHFLVNLVRHHCRGVVL